MCEMGGSHNIGLNFIENKIEKVELFRYDSTVERHLVLELGEPPTRIYKDF